MIVTTHDYQRLMGVIESDTLKITIPDIVSRLHRELRDATILNSDRIPAHVITMNSSVVIRNLSTMMEAEITLVYPDDAEPARGRVSVCSVTGIALLGRKTGDVVCWKTPLNDGRFSILKITYQPEAVGVYLS